MPGWGNKQQYLLGSIKLFIADKTSTNELDMILIESMSGTTFGYVADIMMQVFINFHY